MPMATVRRIRVGSLNLFDEKARNKRNKEESGRGNKMFSRNVRFRGAHVRLDHVGL